MADGRTLVTAYISDAGLKQCLGDSENAFSREHLAGTQPQTLDLFLEGTLRHVFDVALPFSPDILAKFPKIGQIDNWVSHLLA